MLCVSIFALKETIGNRNRIKTYTYSTVTAVLLRYQYKAKINNAYCNSFAVNALKLMQMNYFNNQNSKSMKKNKFKLLFSLLVIIGTCFSINSSSAFIKEPCPISSCDLDCSTGTSCTIKQYKKDGTLCSTTTCNGYGPRFE